MPPPLQDQHSTILEVDQLSRTRALHEKRYHVANDEDLCQPPSSDDGMLFTIRDQDDPSEAHVDTSREDRRCDQNEDRVRRVYWDCEIRSLACCNGSLWGIYQYNVAW